jgi:hypothetical protein
MQHSRNQYTQFYGHSEKYVIGIYKGAREQTTR